MLNKTDMLFDIVAGLKKDIAFKNSLAKAKVHIANEIIDFTHIDSGHYITLTVETDCPVVVNIWMLDYIKQHDRAMLVADGITHGKYDWASETYIKPSAWIKFTV